MTRARQAHRDRVAPHNVTGSSPVLVSGKPGRMRQVETRHAAAPVTVTTGGTVKGRQAALSPDRKRTALLWAIG
jgi:hypothetical protein